MSKSLYREYNKFINQWEYKKEKTPKFCTFEIKEKFSWEIQCQQKKSLECNEMRRLKTNHLSLNLMFWMKQVNCTQQASIVRLFLVYSKHGVYNS